MNVAEPAVSHAISQRADKRLNNRIVLIVS